MTFAVHSVEAEIQRETATLTVVRSCKVTPLHFETIRLSAGF